MHPVLFTLPDWFPLVPDGFAIHTYGVMIAIGVLAASYAADWWGEQDGLPEGFFKEVGFWVLVAGIIGSRAEYVRVNWDQFEPDLMRVLALRDGGLVFYGALLAALPTLVVLTLKRGQDLPRVLDAIAPAIPIMHMFGRTGCFAAGCCHGQPSDVGWGVIFTDPTTVAPLDVALHPTQLYAATYLAVLVLFLVWLRGRKRFNGQIMLAYLSIYPVLRSINEIFRGDSARGFVFEDQLGQVLSNAQAISLSIGLVSAITWLVLWQAAVKARRPLAKPNESEDSGDSAAG
jgi:phosphatidylglycerol:prolipoprotein diacylglycerol transferase